MPRITYGPVVKGRTLKLLEILLQLAQENANRESDKFRYRWNEDAGEHSLNIQTDLNTLKYLSKQQEFNIVLSKTQIREALHLLKNFLQLLTDHRTRTQGADAWHFTLHLWSSDTVTNLNQASALWDQLREGKGSTNLKDTSPQKVFQAVNETPEINFSFPPPFTLRKHRDWLENIFIEEIISMLRVTDIFNRASYINKIKKAETDPFLLSILNGTTVPLICNLERTPNRTIRLGWELEQAKQLINTHPLHFVISPAHAGTLAIFTYIQSQNVSITFDYQHPHSVEIVEQALNDKFFTKVDGFTLTLATAGVLLREKTGKYSSSFMMPSLTHGLLAASNTNNLNMDGNYLLMKELPSTEYLLYKDLFQSGSISNSSTTEMEPDEVTQSLNTGDQTVRSIIGFPHYNFNLHFNKCILLNTPLVTTKPVFLFLRNSHLINSALTEALSILIRNAWLSIMENPLTLKTVAKKLVCNTDYITTLCRITGINRLDNDLSPIFNKIPQPIELNKTSKGFSYKRTDVNSIIKLRHKALRDGYPISEVNFDEDDHASTRHYGVFDNQGHNICCVTLIQSFWNGESAWQLRAMATSENLRNRGIGRAMIEYLLEDLEQNEQLKTIWCNSRVKSLGFYKKMGWREASQQFVNGNAGLSLKMVRIFSQTKQDDEQHLSTII